VLGDSLAVCFPNSSTDSAPEFLTGARARRVVLLEGERPLCDVVAAACRVSEGNLYGAQQVHPDRHLLRLF